LRGGEIGKGGGGGVGGYTRDRKTGKETEVDRLLGR